MKTGIRKNLPIPVELLKEMKRQAANTDVFVYEIVEEAWRCYLEKHVPHDSEGRETTPPRRVSKQERHYVALLQQLFATQPGEKEKPGRVLDSIKYGLDSLVDTGHLMVAKEESERVESSEIGGHSGEKGRRIRNISGSIKKH